MTNWEAIALIHADCDGLEPEQLLQKHGPLRATAYHKGDVGSGGRTHTISGFKVDLGSATSKAELEERVLTHLRDHAALYGEVAKNSGHVSLGIGLMVPPAGVARALTTDGNGAYLQAAEGAFGMDIDYAMLVKIYGAAPEGQRRYSLAICTGCKRTAVSGNPDPAHVSTSYIERQNLTMRMSMRRFKRLTNAFSTKVENHEAAINLYSLSYNFGRVHSSLRVTPAMAAGISDHVWTLGEIIALLN